MFQSACMVPVKLLLGAICLVLLLAVGGCGGGESGGPTGSEGAVDQPPKVVELSHGYFEPPKLTIGVGEAVIFRNLETMSHPLSNEELGLNTGEFTKEDRTLTFDQPGTFTITNIAHGTTFTIVVQSGGN